MLQANYIQLACVDPGCILIQMLQLICRDCGILYLIIQVSKLFVVRVKAPAVVHVVPQCSLTFPHGMLSCFVPGSSHLPTTPGGPGVKKTRNQGNQQLSATDLFLHQKGTALNESCTVHHMALSSWTRDRTTHEPRPSGNSGLTRPGANSKTWSSVDE